MTTETGQRSMMNRRRLLTLTATGVSAAAFGALSRPTPAYAADTVRWVSPRGTVEVLDDYPYWVGKKFGYFGDIDYGVRAHLAGFKLVCAKGAWLFHETGHADPPKPQ